MVSKILKKLPLLALLSTSLWANDGQTDVKQVAKADIYSLDKSHSQLGFKVSHLGIASVSGSFKDFLGELVLENGKLIGAKAEIKVPSIFTDDTKRDEHLKADDFFAAKQHPLVKFESTSVKLSGKNVEMTGNLTMRDKTLPITLTGVFNGTVHVEMWKMSKAGLSLKGSINRQDFGLKFSKFLGTGEAMVGDVVELQIDLEANKPD